MSYWNVCGSQAEVMSHSHMRQPNMSEDSVSHTQTQLNVLADHAYLESFPDLSCKYG